MNTGRVVSDVKGRILAGALALFGALAAAQVQAAGVSTADVEGWLKRYGDAWVGVDADAAAALFTENAIYHENPHEAAFEGRQAIRDYWARVTADQRDITFSSKVITTFGNSAVAHWAARFRSASSGAVIHLDGVFLLEFAEGGLCSALREWWIVKVDAPQP